ncbi:FMN-binding negative transcriptional regulator [Variovorax rhizosphaerae]|uniref:FMN-binding negative transcriptional regulator n=1 Tax=Variovorax rhizosphaerae TaxID=1836200 RepID=A0ABU8WWE5_9BURK
MYIAPHHEERDLAALQSLMQAHPLGAWVTPGLGGLVANHIPFVLDKDRGEFGTLRAHVARANPVWRELPAAVPSLVIFQGPQSYITPSWYPGKQVDGKVVPTWNYVAVHAGGVASAIHDRDWIMQAITDLTHQSESGRIEPWRITDAPREYIEGLSRAIVGIEIPIASISGKWKLSQDEAIADRVGTVAGLRAGGDANSLAMSRLVAERIEALAR